MRGASWLRRRRAGIVLPVAGLLLVTTPFVVKVGLSDGAEATSTVSEDEILAATLTPSTDDDPVTLGEVADSLFLMDTGAREEIGVPELFGATDAVTWMESLGLTTGMNTPATSADTRITRGDLAVILHRFAGSPFGPAEAFADVERHLEKQAVAWLRGVGLTTGTSPTTFSPDRPATRGEFAAFLDRLDDVPSNRVPYGVAHTIVQGRAIADPWIVPVDDGYVLYTTQDGYVSMPVWTSDDLETWEFIGDGLPKVPAWVKWGKNWAPDVIQHNGRWHLFFSANHVEDENMCIGHAVADDRFGPFVGEDEPLVCQPDRGGAIDPRTFVDVDGRRYLHWKSDDNSKGNGDETALWAQELDDELQFIGPRTQLLASRDAPNLGTIIESPQMIEHDGRYELTFSGGGGFLRPSQFIGTARCDGPLGPCVAASTPLIASNDDGPGPGEHSLFTDHDGSLHVAYGPFHEGHRNLLRLLALAEVRPGADGLEVVVPETHPHVSVQANQRETAAG